MYARNDVNSPPENFTLIVDRLPTHIIRKQSIPAKLSNGLINEKLMKIEDE
jgi:hypothetical protein